MPYWADRLAVFSHLTRCQYEPKQTGLVFDDTKTMNQEGGIAFMPSEKRNYIYQLPLGWSVSRRFMKNPTSPSLN